MVTRLAPEDSWFLYSSSFKTDMFLVYAFAGTPSDLDAAADDVIRRARQCPDLRLRVSALGLGRAQLHWVSGDVEADQVIVDVPGGADWPAVLRRMGELVEDGQLNTRKAMWRLHVFPGVPGVPGALADSTVAALQMSHALADGVRSSMLAGILFGRPDVVMPEVARRAPGRALTRNSQYVLWRRRLARATERGLVPPPPAPLPPLSINNAPTGATELRTVVRRRSQMPNYPVTIGALVAVSEALSGYLQARGEDVSSLTALVPVARRGWTESRNRWVTEFVRLYPQVRSRDERAALIATGLEQSRLRSHHPAVDAKSRALSALPAPVLRWVSTRPLPTSRTGLAHTSLSSLYRGPADLNFGGCPVIMTAGYPALTPFIGLAHGVHGIGDTLAISVHTTDSAMTDVDEYMERLDAGLHP